LFFTRTWRVKAVITTRLSLRDFPFDSQTLTMSLRIPRVHREGIARVLCAEASADSFHDDRSIVAAPVPTGSEDDDGSVGLSIEDSWFMRSISQRIQHRAPGEENFKPEYVVQLRLRRRPNFYLSNIVMPNALLTVLHYAVYLLPAEDLGNRFAIILTLLLALVTFKAAVASFLPVLAYETRLDRHALWLIALIVATGFESMLVYVMQSSERLCSALQPWVAPVLSGILSMESAPDANESTALLVQSLNSSIGLLSFAIFVAYNIVWFRSVLYPPSAPQANRSSASSSNKKSD
jgi:hypothetical protein